MGGCGWLQDVPFADRFAEVWVLEQLIAWTEAGLTFIANYVSTEAEQKVSPLCQITAASNHSPHL